MAKRGEALTLGAGVCEELRDDILSGKLGPGEPLRPAQLRHRFDVSIGVVREALTRLSESHLVTNEPNQGFAVRTLSEKDLNRLLQVRLHVEPFALRLAIESGGLGWETDVIAAHHRLIRTPRNLPDDGDLSGESVNPAWLAAHEAFHLQLLSGCDNPMLLTVCARLFDSFALYRRWSAPAAQRERRDVEAEHLAIMNATVGRDASTAGQRLIEHIERTASLALDSVKLGAHGLAAGLCP
jgi:DNA-binding GntR family transcriptional regulator